MPLIFWASTAFLVLALGYSVWCLVSGRPTTDRSVWGVLMMAIIFVPVGWQR